MLPSKTYKATAPGRRRKVHWESREASKQTTDEHGDLDQAKDDQGYADVEGVGVHIRHLGSRCPVESEDTKIGNPGLHFGLRRLN